MKLDDIGVIYLLHNICLAHRIEKVLVLHQEGFILHLHSQSVLLRICDTLEIDFEYFAKRTLAECCLHFK